MINIRITIEYDGKDFNGWQKQPTKLNIQGESERAIGIITGEEVEVVEQMRVLMLWRKLLILKFLN